MTARTIAAKFKSMIGALEPIAGHPLSFRQRHGAVRTIIGQRDSFAILRPVERDPVA